MQLTEHFILAEFTRSATAARLGIDNTPPPGLIETLRATARRMEHVRLILGVPVHATSVYRCEALERVLCERAFKAWCARRRRVDYEIAWRDYFAGKAHPKGMAVDFTAPAFGSPLKVCRALAGYADELEFDQLIHEYDEWTHIGWSADHPRRQLLTINAGGTAEGLA